MSVPGADGRFAPCPTGPLHVGNLRTALLAWLFARSAGARFLVRMEDLDRPRVRPDSEQEQLADLRALGLDRDGPVARQSERMALYGEAISRLDTGGLLYPCYCTRAEGARMAFQDRLLGHCEEEVDDFVVRRNDGAPAYQLAVVVDDADQGIGEVVRGADLVDSTPRQLLLYRLLGLSAPSYAHVPLVLGPDGRRLAKRHGAVTLADRRALGEVPVEILAWMASSLGLAEQGERPTPADLLARFDPARLPLEPTVWSPEPAEPVN